MAVGPSSRDSCNPNPLRVNKREKYAEVLEKIKVFDPESDASIDSNSKTKPSIESQAADLGILKLVKLEDSGVKTFKAGDETFRISSAIGRGNQGKVFNCTLGEQEYVAKQLTGETLLSFSYTANSESTFFEDFIKLVEIEDAIGKHPNIATHTNAFYESDDGLQLYILYEKLDKPPGSISNIPKAFTKWLSDGLNALKVIHNKGYVHRDIRTDNILFRSSSDGLPTLVIVDLGSAAKADATNYNTSVAAETEVVRLIEAAENTTQSITQKQKDIVMLGITLAELCLGLKTNILEDPLGEDNYLQALDKLEKKT